MYGLTENSNKNPIAINKDFKGTENNKIEVLENTKVEETGNTKVGATEDTKVKAAIEYTQSDNPNIKEITDTTAGIEAKTIENKSAVANRSPKIKGVVKTRKSTDLRKSKSNFFYTGIIAGPDLSTVKLERIINTGYTLGLIAGYAFDSKLSIESGLFLDKKYYYSKGKYFKTKNVNLPYHAKIENVDGYCNMIEWPLNVKYNFKSNGKINWFVVAGISSYFMNKENYDYRYSVYGQQRDSNLVVKDNSKTLASVMNVSLGYSHQIGKKITLRIEPYIKIPFKGIGVGSLPITSSGVYLGFTKNLF